MSGIGLPLAGDTLESITFEFVTAISLSACDFDGAMPEKAAPVVKDDSVLVKATVQRRFDVHAADGSP